MVLFTDQSYPSFGVSSFTLGSNECKKIRCQTKIKHKALIYISAFVSTVKDSVHVLYNIERDGETIIGGQRDFILNDQSKHHCSTQPSEQSYSTYFHDKKVKSGKHVYTLTFFNNGKEKIVCDNYTFSIETDLGKVFSSNYYPSNSSPLGEDSDKYVNDDLNFKHVSRFHHYRESKEVVETKGFVIKPDESKKFALDVNIESKSTQSCFVHFSAQIKVEGKIRQVFFNVNRENSLTSGTQLLTTKYGSHSVNWSTFDAKVPNGKHVYTIEIFNQGVGDVCVESFSFIVVPKRYKEKTHDSCEEYFKKEKEIKGKSNTNFYVDFCSIVNLNFHFKFKGKANLFFNVKDKNHRSLTNGPQPWFVNLAHVGGSHISHVLLTNQLEKLIDKSIDKSMEENSLIIEFINQDDTPVQCVSYSIKAW